MQCIAKTNYFSSKRKKKKENCRRTFKIVYFHTFISHKYYAIVNTKENETVFPFFSSFLPFSIWSHNNYHKFTPKVFSQNINSPTAEKIARPVTVSCLFGGWSTRPDLVAFPSLSVAVYDQARTLPERWSIQEPEALCDSRFLCNQTLTGLGSK